MVELEPVTVMSDVTLRIIDIRSPEERLPPIGYIPGSRLFPENRLRNRSSLLSRMYPGNLPLVLCCMTGRRSGALVHRIQAQGFSQVFSLRGGVLGWGRAGLPLCGQTHTQAVPHALHTPDEIIDAIASSFVVATVESDLDNRRASVGFNPRVYVRQLFEKEIRFNGDTRQAMFTALDKLAEVARLRGHRLDRIANNIDEMLGMIQHIPST